MKLLISILVIAVPLFAFAFIGLDNDDDFKIM